MDSLVNIAMHPQEKHRRDSFGMSQDQLAEIVGRGGSCCEHGVANAYGSCATKTGIMIRI